MKLSKGRIPSLLAWGLLVGGVALLITFPEVEGDTALFIGAVPAALLFVLAGLVFGLSHPDGRDWMGALLFGWVPAVVGVVAWIRGTGPGAVAPWLVVVLPAILAAFGAGLGASLARWRTRRA